LNAGRGFLFGGVGSDSSISGGGGSERRALSVLEARCLGLLATRDDDDDDDDRHGYA
jgi:hypothetical protein